MPTGTFYLSDMSGVNVLLMKHIFVLMLIKGWLRNTKYFEVRKAESNE